MSLSITWHGVSCFKIKSKLVDDEVSVITDPYDSSCGLRVSKTLSANIVTVSMKHPHHDNISAVSSARADKDLFVIDSPGEYEVSNIFVYGIQPPTNIKEKNIIYRFELGGYSVVHLGNLNYEPSSKEIEVIGDVDVLFVPVGNENVLETKKIVDLISSVDPRFVIPMDYKISGLKTKAEPAEKLLKELGVKQFETVKKLKVSRKDFGEEMKVVVIEKD